MERAGLDIKKKIIFLFTHLLLKFTVSFPCEDQWQTTVLAVPVSVCHQEKSQIFSCHITSSHFEIKPGIRAATGPHDLMS